MKNLFEAMARHRPEWLAQGLLMRALETEPRVRATLLEKLGWKHSPDDVPEITEEEVTVGGWRADVCVNWKGEKAKLELKLLAGFTQRQEEAMQRSEVDLVVLPQKLGRELREGLHVLTWDELAESVQTDSVLKRLLKEVGLSSTWALEDISYDPLCKEFDSFVKDRTHGSWPQMYRFLSTIHLHLLEGAPTTYRASDGWARSWTGSKPYYGFCFWLGEAEKPRFWVGFWRPKQAGQLVFEVTVPSSGDESIFLEADRFDAAALAQRVLDAAEKRLKQNS